MARKSRQHPEPASEPPIKQKVYDAGAYVRLSAEDRKRKGDSIETQQAIISAFVAGRSDIVLRETYIDDGVSGQTFERPAFQRMLADLESGKINSCLSKDLSRLGRNAIDTSYYIEKYFPAHQIRYIAINDDYDSADENSGGIKVNLKNIVNETYALEIGRKIRDTKQMNIRSGCFVGRIAPYGYLKSGENGHRLIPDEYAAPIVRRVFEMAAEGASIRDITKWLNSTGILPPKRYLHSIGLASEKEAGGHIHCHRGVIYGMLRNRVYCGDMVQGKGRTYSYVVERLPKSEWVVTENTHEGIVSRELFEKAQKRRVMPDKPVKSKRYKTPATENVFLRKVFCGHCGHAMRRLRTGESQYIFICATRQYYDSSDCTLVSINENALKEELFTILRQKALVFIDAVKPADVSAKEDAAYKSELQIVQAELKRNQVYFKSLYESRVNGVIENEDEYKRMKRFYGEKIEELIKREKALSENARDRHLKDAESAKAAKSYQSIESVIDITPEVIGALIDKILVFEDRSIEIRFKFRDETGDCDMNGAAGGVGRE